MSSKITSNALVTALSGALHPYYHRDWKELSTGSSLEDLRRRSPFPVYNQFDVPEVPPNSFPTTDLCEDFDLVQYFHTGLPGSGQLLDDTSSGMLVLTGFGTLTTRYSLLGDNSTLAEINVEEVHLNLEKRSVARLTVYPLGLHLPFVLNLPPCTKISLF